MIISLNNEKIIIKWVNLQEMLVQAKIKKNQAQIDKGKKRIFGLGVNLIKITYN